MEYSDVQTILLSILTSIITGGFILVFVEIGNRKNRENDRYDQMMLPFMHKLSSYFRFLSWCSHRIKYPKQMSEYETEFKDLVTEIARYGGRAITSGGDYGVDYFAADKLNDICFSINNIWYYHDKMNPCRLTWDDGRIDNQFIAKELKEIFPHYLTHTVNVNLVSQVSGDFYTDIYQPIEYETYKHETYVEHFKRQSVVVSLAVSFVLFVLVLMLFMDLSVGFMQFSGVATIVLLVVCLLMLRVDTKVQIQHYNKLIVFFANMRKCKTDKNTSPTNSNITLCKMFQFIFNTTIYIGLLLSTWAVLSIEIGILPKIPVLWEETIVQGVNRILLNLSYSYIAGVIVYWFAVKLPALKENNL